MTKISRPLLFVLLAVLFLNVSAQENRVEQKQDSLMMSLVLKNGKAQINNLQLFPDSTELENLYLEFCLTNPFHPNTYSQFPIRIEIEQLVNGKKERIEIARFFLPWLDKESMVKPLFVFDLSAYSLLFLEATNIFVESYNIQQALEFNMHFHWKIGQAPIKAKHIENLWRSEMPGLSYSAKTTSINKQIDTKTIEISKDIKYALLKIYLSGMVTNNKRPNEADYSKFYFLNINKQTVAKRPVWRDDCSLNAIFPQKGPWTLSRPNWCPGQALRVYNHFIPLGLDTTLSIELQLQKAVNENSMLQHYLLSANLILYEDAEFENDAAIVEILAPNKSIDHNRYNPICGSPVIRVRNTGSDTLRTVLIQYGLNDTTDNRYRWRGELAFMEEEIVYLPPLNWYFYGKNYKPENFCVLIEEVNGKKDEYLWNNHLSTALNLAPVYPNKIRIQYTAIEAANENIIELVDDMGVPLFEAVDFVCDSTYTFDLDLLPGCYEFIVYDQAGDGINLPNKKTGSLKIIDAKTEKELIDFEPNFGAEIRQQFMILK